MRRGHFKYEMTPEILLDTMCRWGRDYGDMYTISWGGYMIGLKAIHPRSVKIILNNTEHKDAWMYGCLKPWLGDGLLISEGQKWARNRKLLTPAFHFDSLKTYVPIFSASSNILVTKWKKLLETTRSVELFEDVSMMTFDSLLKCTFGVTTNCQTQQTRDPYLDAVYELSKLIFKRLVFLPYQYEPLFNVTADGRRFKKMKKFVQEYAQKIIKTRRQRREMTSDKEKKTAQRKYVNFLDTLLDAKDQDGCGLSDYEIQNEVDTFMFAGHDTTASAVSWCLYNLANHPIHQDKCREEVMDVIANRDDVKWQDLSKLKYLTMCLKESLRLTTTIPNISRLTSKPIMLPDGRTIPSGTWVGIGIHELHHNPEVWDDPEHFDPHRFTAENTSARPIHAYIPFSAGPRNCIGQHFAMAEIKTSLALLIKNFRFQPDETKSAVMYPEISLRSMGGLWLNIDLPC